MEFVLVGLNAVLLVAMVVLYQYVKGIPEAVHRRQLQDHQIRESFLHPRRAEQTANLVRETAAEMRKARGGDISPEGIEGMLDGAIGVFFTGSDEAVRELIDWRRLGQEEGSPPQELVLRFANVAARARWDQGHNSRDVTADDFMYLFVNDWPNQRGQWLDRFGVTMKEGLFQFRP